MPGGDIQLVLKSNYDAYLIGNPSVSFFKSVFKRHTRFSMELIKIEPKSNKNELLENREIELEFELPHKGNRGGGDLIKQTYFVFELPKIYSHNHYQFQWIKRIGQYIINEVSNTVEKGLRGLIYVVNEMIMISFFLIGLVYLNLKLTLIIFFIFIFIFSIYLFFSKKINSKYAKIRQLNDFKQIKYLN